MRPPRSPATKDLPGSCTYYTDFDFIGNQLSIYDTKVCNGVTQPGYAVIEKVGAAWAR